MSYYLNSTYPPAVSLDFNNSWAAKNLQEALQRAGQKNARFQQKQMQEKEEKLLRLYENQQQRAFDKVSRGSSGSSGGSSPVGVTSSGKGRVRQMFDERRQKAGIDRSYPLEPLRQTTRLNGHVPNTRVSNTDRSNTMAKSPTSRQTTRASMQNSLSQTYTAKTRTVKHTSNAAYTNGNHRHEDDLENDNPLQMMQQQQNQLEMMMNNHNLEENIEDEELIDVGIDEMDESRENSPGPDVIWTNTKNNRNTEAYSEESTPTKKLSPVRPSPKVAPVRKLLPKTNSITKTAPPKSTAVQKATKPVAPSVASKQAPSVASKQAASVRTSASNQQKSTRSALSSVAKDDLQACKYCDRRFATDRVQKHEQICSRTLKKKRKTYDATKHRVQGTEAEVYVRRLPTKAASVKSKISNQPKSDWRRQHEEFIGAIRAAKMAQAHVAAGGKLTDLPPPPPSLNPDYVQCPHCGRRFNAAAAERHIPKCATMLHNKPNRLGPPPKK